MIKRSYQMRYRSIKYSISASQLAPHLSETPALFDRGPERLSLNKQNSTQPEERSSNSQRRKEKQTRPESEWSQNKIYHLGGSWSQNSHSLYLKKKPATQELFLSEVTMPRSRKCPPYQDYQKQLEEEFQTFQPILDETHDEIGAIRKEIVDIETKVCNSLRTTQELVSKQVDRLRRLMECSLKEHSKVVFNARDRIKATGEVYEWGASEMQRLGDWMGILDDNYNG